MKEITLKEYFDNCFLVKQYFFENGNTYVFEIGGFYEIVYCDKENNVLDTLLSEYY